MERIAKYGCLLVLLALGSCKKNDSMTPGGPVTMYLIGRWKLDKIVTPTQEKLADRLGYTEILEVGNDQIEDYEKIFRDEKLISTYERSRITHPVASAKNMTATITYRNGLKRFYKITNTAKLGEFRLETSAYLPEIGTPQDSIKYYYSFIP
ncbi:MAG TPA: hypothetical protein VK404_00745 [Spirosoma sp.]|nr:hypothetical protein [Spirosoma sp.]